MKRDSDKHFLIIGSMKSGTTSIFNDVCQHPDIFSPIVKEPGDLASDAVLTDQGRERYLKLFSGAAPGAWVGEASTVYTRYPMISGVPERARAVLGPDLRLIFVGRDPVSRLRSHYRHEFLSGKINQPLREINLESFAATHISCYDKQLQQWLNVFPPERLLVLRSEDYAAQPEPVIRRIWSHLGVEQVSGDFGKRLNISSGNRVPRGLLRKFILSDMYRRKMRLLLPARLRTALGTIFIRKGPYDFDDELPRHSEEHLRVFLWEATREFRSMAAQVRDNVV